jgi:hypothetical protein
MTRFTSVQASYRRPPGFLHHSHHRAPGSPAPALPALLLLYPLLRLLQTFPLLLLLLGSGSSGGGGGFGGVADARTLPSEVTKLLALKADLEVRGLGYLMESWSCDERVVMGEEGCDPCGPTSVGQCRSKVSKPVLKAHVREKEALPRVRGGTRLSPCLP